MSAGAGSLAITARREGARTVLERVRYDGISRCSRSFEHDGAALVVLSQLGPGVVRGDAVQVSGHIRADARLIVTSQAATRLMGGARRSNATSTWSLDPGGVLELVGEPLVASVDARYASSTTVDLEAGALVLISEITRVAGGADVRLQTSVRQAGRELLYDAFEPAAVAPHAVGSFAVVGLNMTEGAAVVGALDQCADALKGVHVGVGALTGGAFVRVLATGVWDVRWALSELRQAAWTQLRLLAHENARLATRC